MLNKIATPAIFVLAVITSAALIVTSIKADSESFITDLKDMRYEFVVQMGIAGETPRSELSVEIRKLKDIRSDVEELSTSFSENEDAQEALITAMDTAIESLEIFEANELNENDMAESVTSLGEEYNDQLAEFDDMVDSH